MTGPRRAKFTASAGSGKPPQEPGTGPVVEVVSAQRDLQAQKEDAFQRLARSYVISARARNLSPRSVDSYRRALNDFHRYLLTKHMPVDPQTLTREHIEAFIGDRLHATNKRSGNPLLPATAADRYRILHVFFNWLVEIGELQRSPMEHMKHPKQKIAPPPVLTEDQLQAMLSTCSGPSFYDRRDLAILLVLMDTGMRLMELTNIQIEDIDWDAYPQPTILILGKGDKERRVAINPITQNALNMYINLVRSKHRWSGEPDLWLGRDGGLSDAGITYAIKQRAKAAGLSGRVFPHMFRHTFAHMWLRSGGSETDLCRICGWDDIQMVHERYGASAANARAQEAHQVHSPVRNLRLGGRGRQNRDQKRRR